MLCDECHKHEASIYVTEITSQGQDVYKRQ